MMRVRNIMLLLLAGAILIVAVAWLPVPRPVVAAAGAIMAFTGVIVLLAGAVGCMIAIYQKSEDWAFWSFLFDVVFLLAAARYRAETKKHAMIALAGLGLLVVGSIVAEVFSS